MHSGFKRGERDAHIGMMRRDGVFAGAEDCADPVDAINGRASRARPAFVARRRRVVEVKATRALQQVSTS